jgi:hypothetical protein
MALRDSFEMTMLFLPSIILLIQAGFYYYLLIFSWKEISISSSIDVILD